MSSVTPSRHLTLSRHLVVHGGRRWEIDGAIFRRTDGTSELRIFKVHGGKPNSRALVAALEQEAREFDCARLKR